LDAGHLPEDQPAQIDALSRMYPPASDDFSDQGEDDAASRGEENPPDILEASRAIGTLTGDDPLPQDVIDADLLPVFLEEAVVLVEGFYAQIKSWRADRSSDAPSRTLARILHTFKGSSRMAGALHLGQFTQEVETHVRQLAERGEEISDQGLNGIQAACDVVAQVVAFYQAGNHESATQLLQQKLAAFPASAASATPAFASEPEFASAPEPVPVNDVPESAPTPVTATGAADTLDASLLPVFLEEAVELVNGFYTQIQVWRANKSSNEPAHALARILHTFKGSSRMAGAMRLGQFTHEVESRVDELSTLDVVTDSDLDEIEAACDIMARVMEAYQAGDFDLAHQSFGNVPAAAKVTPETPKATPAPPSKKAATKSKSAPVPNATPEPPPAQAVAPEPLPAQAAAPEPAAPEADAGQRAMLRVRADLVDRLVNEAGELSIARARIEGEMRELKDSLLNLTDNVIRLRHQLREIEIQAETQIQAGTDDESKVDFDPLELDRFTRFQELTRMMAESVNDVSTVQQNLLKNLDDANAAIIAQARLNRGLQQSLMGVRMVPFDSQSERLQRLVRQVSKELGKRAHLEIQGGQVEMDRSVLENVFSPLEHMVRNSLAHGLEDAKQRRALGKPEIGQIRISVTQEGNEVVLALSDDGAGLDMARIRAKAEKSGLIAPGEPVEEQRLMGFIFQTGFSTATKVSQVAGRGVGMDVVKTGIASLGGRIEVVTEAGKGTTFQLYLPLTLAVTQAVLVRVSGRVYAIPSAMVEQVMEVREKPLREIRERGEAIWQDGRYPFHYLPHLLGDPEAQQEQRRLYWILLLRSGAQRVSILIDDMIGNQEVVVKNIGPQMARVVGIAGTTVLGDGEVVLILNPVALATRLPTLVAQTQKAALSTPTLATRQPTVLVVDDSLTVRKITQKLLVREGYQVELAKDGVDALEHLVDLVPDVILSDIEMPRMDGFDLVRHIRADGRLDKVPVIMITSRTAEKHRNHALEVGAN
ncbi:MAG: response regulator, partial [Zoogloeaceae bacterium]|nr:response regulator [Zoogloeaceae bacterium]